MKLRRKIALLSGGLVLITLFQNCGQAGSIVSSEALSNGAASADPVSDLPDTSNSASYRDLSKVVTVENSTSQQVDILVVVDNSGSMATEQKNMANRFDTFIDQLQGLDWRVAITTTDVAYLESNPATANTSNDGRLLKFSGTEKYYLSSQDDLTTVKQSFGATVQRSETGSAAEQGIRATYRAIERAQESSGQNKDFLRAGAALAVVVVTDADETPFTSIAPYRNDGSKLRTMISALYPSKAFVFHSIIVKDGDSSCLKLAGSGNEAYGLKYQALSEATGGVVGSVCESDYGSQLKVMGQATADLVKLVTLDCEPVDSDKDGQVDVVIKNAYQVAITDFVVNKSQIQFAQPLPVGSYTVAYKCMK